MSTAARCEEELHILWMMLDLEFMALKPASYQEAADQLLDNILWKERLRKGLEGNENEHAVSDLETLEKIRSWDTNDPQFAVLEKVLRRLATNRGGDAMGFFKSSIESRQEQLRKRQQAIAKKPRLPRHPLSNMVDPIVRTNPSIKENDLFYALRKVITNMTDPPCTFSGESFKPSQKTHPDVPRKNLRQYLYRAKKKLSR